MSTWYLGPLGDLRPLRVPEPGLSINEVRYGGIHQGLSGARTMDVTGFRTEFEFEIKHLELDEYVWLEALHTRMVPGPFHLLNPFKRNRLTGQASRLVPIEARNSGVYVTAAHSFSREWPDEVTVPGRSMRLAGWSGSNCYIQFDQKKPAPLLKGEYLTTSVYLRADAGHNAYLRVSWYDRDNAFISNTDHAIGITTEWSRYWFTHHEAPVNAAGALFTIVLSTANTAVFIAAPMLEGGQAFPSDWEIGGGAPVVVVDQLPAVSTRFPLRTANLTLLET